MLVTPKVKLSKDPIFTKAFILWYGGFDWAYGYTVVKFRTEEEAGDPYATVIIPVGKDVYFQTFISWIGYDDGDTVESQISTIFVKEGSLNELNSDLKSELKCSYTNLRLVGTFELDGEIKKIDITKENFTEVTPENCGLLKEYPVLADITCYPRVNRPKRK